MHILTLLEAPRDEVILQNIASYITGWLVHRLHETDIAAEPRSTFFIPELNAPTLKIKDIVMKGSWGHLYNTLAHTSLVFRVRITSGTETQFGNDHERGAYHYDMNMITINATANMEGELLDVDQVESTLLHELRHRVDGKLSNNKALDARGKRSGYWNDPAEINARFSQALRDISQPLRDSIKAGKPMTANEFIARFEQVAAKYNLIDVFSVIPSSSAETFLKFIENGVFGRITSPKDAHMFALAVAKSKEGQPVGPVNDKQYRRLLARVVQMYHHIMDEVQ